MSPNKITLYHIISYVISAFWYERGALASIFRSPAAGKFVELIRGGYTCNLKIWLLGFIHF